MEVKMRGKPNPEKIKNFNSKTRQEKFEIFYKYRTLVKNMVKTSGLCSRTYMDVNDITQEVFCRVWLYIDDYDVSKASVPRYLSKITISVIMNSYKLLNSKKREGHVLTISLSEVDDLNRLETISVDDEYKNIERDLNNKVIMEEVLKEFSQREQDIIIKRFYEDKTMEKIGNELHITKQRVDQILGKLTKKLISYPVLQGIII